MKDNHQILSIIGQTQMPSSTCTSELHEQVLPKYNQKADCVRPEWC